MGCRLKYLIIGAFVMLLTCSICVTPAYCKPGKDKEKVHEKNEKASDHASKNKDKKKDKELSRFQRSETPALTAGAKTTSAALTDGQTEDTDSALEKILTKLAGALSASNENAPNKPSIAKPKAALPAAPPEESPAF